MGKTALNKAYEVLNFIDKPTMNIVHDVFLSLIKENINNKQIAQIAFEFFSWKIDKTSLTEQQYNALYDLSLIDEEHMDGNRDRIIRLIEKLV